MVKVTETPGYRVRELRRFEKRTPKARIRLRLTAVHLVWDGCPAPKTPTLMG